MIVQVQQYRRRSNGDARAVHKPYKRLPRSREPFLERKRQGKHAHEMAAIETRFEATARSHVVRISEENFLQ